MPADRSFTRHWVNGGRAWMHSSLTYPPRWILSIPTGPDRRRDEDVSSLDEALQVVAQRGLELDVDDWTYASMVEHGVAPAARPEPARQPADRYPGAGLGDDRQISLDVLQHAPDFIGLTAQAAAALAQDRGIDVRFLDEHTVAVTADYAPARLNLRLQGQRVVTASIG